LYRHIVQPLASNIRRQTRTHDNSSSTAEAPLEDPNHERELFVSEVPFLSLADGNVVVTLATLRPEETVAGQQPKMQRVVVGRIVLTNSAAGQLMKSLQGLAAHIEAMAKKTATSPS
jgi:hypothetical protein